MADPIRAAAERLLKYLEANRGHDGMFPLSESQEEFNLRAALAAEPPAPAEPDTDAVLSLAAIIRRVDGSNSLGAAALAEAILSHPDVTSVFQPPASVPVPVAARPWEQPGWCDAEGRCWWFAPTEAIAGGFRSAGWSLYAKPPADEDTHCLPHWAIPQPPQCGEVA